MLPLVTQSNVSHTNINFNGYEFTFFKRVHLFRIRTFIIYFIYIPTTTLLRNKRSIKRKFDIFFTSLKWYKSIRIVQVVIFFVDLFYKIFTVNPSHINIIYYPYSTNLKFSFKNHYFCTRYVRIQYIFLHHQKQIIRFWGTVRNKKTLTFCINYSQ